MSKQYYNLQYRVSDPARYYVYVHRRLSDNAPFYVGKGCRDRAWTFSGRNSHWENVKNKHGITVEILFDNLTEVEALQVEVDTILEYEYFGYDLTNKTSGGETVTFSPETLFKMSSAKIGRELAEETKRRIAKSLTGIKRSKEEIAKSAKSRSGINSKLADKAHYTFIHVSGESFKGTRVEFADKYGLESHVVKKLFGKNPRLNSKGWSILNETEHTD